MSTRKQFPCKISIVWGSGLGNTPVSAFDQALKRAGIHEYNLIKLSSVIPAHCEVIEREHWQDRDSQRGDRMYVVFSKAIVPPGGDTRWIGLGWINVPEKGGIFVELQGPSYDVLVANLQKALREMSTYRPHLGGGDPRFRVVRVASTGTQFASGIVAAVYKVISW